MPRRPTGSITERRGKRGRVYMIRYRVQGERQSETLPAGSDRRAAERLLADRLAQARLGLLEPRSDPGQEQQPPDRTGVQTLHAFASAWAEQRRHELRPRSYEAIVWALTHHLLEPLGSYRMDELTPAIIDGYRLGKIREREVQAALIADWQRQDRKTRGRRPSRGLSNRSINATLAVLAQVWDAASEDGVVSGQNPARGRRRRLKAEPPRQRFLEPDQVAVLLDHAGEHRALVAMLCLGGLRVSELCQLRWQHVDLGRGRLEVIDSKTDAGIRQVPLTPLLREALVEHRAASMGEGYVFPSAVGTMRDRHAVRNRIVIAAVTRANRALEAAGEQPMPRVTPHDLRRTAISLWLAGGADVPSVMAWAGHLRPDVTLSIYAKVLRRGVDHGAAIDALIAPRLGTSPVLVPNHDSEADLAR